MLQGVTLSIMHSPSSIHAFLFSFSVLMLLIIYLFSRNSSFDPESLILSFCCFFRIDASALPYLMKNFSHWNSWSSVSFLLIFSFVPYSHWHTWSNLFSLSGFQKELYKCVEWKKPWFNNSDFLSLFLSRSV